MPSSPSLDRITYRLTEWRRKLIDLSRRNRLLNYRPTQASTVELEEGAPAEILRHLMEGRSFEFEPRPEPDQPGDSQHAEPLDPVLLEGGTGAASALPNGADDDEATRRPRNMGRLRSRLLERRLATNLLNIYRRADESLDEQGVNTLFLAFGMLEWYEDEQSDRGSRAPLLMVPVQLSRASAASPFVLSSRDEEVVLNPAIVEKLRLDFHIDLPALPEASEDLDLATLFRAIQRAVRNLGRWRVVPDVALGLFSFQKFVMYLDLERNGDRAREHRVVRAMCREGDEQPGRGGLPPEIEGASIDDEMSPWATVQVLDADSSQQRAMLAVRKGNDLVIEGPPGTGKSQTIANLIADALHEGKTVLFVSEKMAALEVVRTRLEAYGDLGNHVLELHSNKTSKTEFVRALAGSLDASPGGGQPDVRALDRLSKLTTDLREYVVELHRPEPPMGRSPFQVIGHLVQLADVPFLPAELPGLAEVTAASLEEAEGRLEELARTLSTVVDPEVHPLRGLGLENTSRTQARALETLAAEALELLEDLVGRAEGLATEFGLRRPDTLADTHLVAESARVVADSPGGDPSILSSPRWNEISADARELLETGHRYAERRPEVAKRFRPEVLDRNLTEEIAAYAGSLDRGGWRLVTPAYWRSRRALRSFLLPGYRPEDPHALLDDARLAHAARQDRVALIEAEPLGRELFGQRWQGLSSDWEELVGFADWVVSFRRCVLKELLGDRGLEVAAAGAVNFDEVTPRLEALEERIHHVRRAVTALVQEGDLGPVAAISAEPDIRLRHLQARIREFADALPELRPFSEYVAARRACDEGFLADYTHRALAKRVEPAELIQRFRRLFWESWLERILEDRPVLKRFQSGRHEACIREFRELDHKSLALARDRVHKALATRRQDLLSGQLAEELRILQREVRRRRRILPVRKLLLQAGGAIQRINPCFMMSPISVAQFLDPGKFQFDLLVFDEASQIPPPDAIGSMLRARQTVVVGDSKQLPPTNFFGVHLDDADMEEDEELALLEDLESVLDEVAVSGVPSVRLKWHYRSVHQSLIRFSNEEFYQDDPLLVFPSAVRTDGDIGLHFVHVEDGVYEGKGRNGVEARKVAEAVVDHIHRTPTLSLGVGTFGIAQQALIQDELDRLRREDPSIEWFFQQEGEGKFFVKNLENIQGDDRDVIFLSVTYGPDRNGRVHRNFGPINKAGGWRRLNVLTTRAKRLLRVFSSMTDDQIDTRDVNQGAVLLRNYLHYARTGDYPSPKISAGDPDSPFEEAVLDALRKRGHQLVPQVGEAGYRVDIGVLDPEHPGRYVCGIECDGASYHSAASVRDRDRLRQQVLEDRGWSIHRVWSTDWFHNPQGQIERLEGLIEESLERSRERKPDNQKQEAPGVSLAGNDPDRDTPPPPAEVPSGLSPTSLPLDDLPVMAYQVAPVRLRGTPEDFYTVPRRSIASAVADVLKFEAPLHLTELARRVAGSWHMQRAGTRIVQRIEEAVRSLVWKGEAKCEAGFVTLPDMKKIPVRARKHADVSNAAEHLPPEEVEEAIRLLLRHRAPLLADEVIVMTARLFGFGRTGRRLQGVLKDALDRLIQSGAVRPMGAGLGLVEERGGDESGSPGK